MNSILTIPNLLTFMRMGLIPVFASLLYYGYSGWALAVFMIAGISDANLWNWNINPAVANGDKH